MFALFCRFFSGNERREKRNWMKMLGEGAIKVERETKQTFFFLRTGTLCFERINSEFGFRAFLAYAKNGNRVRIYERSREDRRDPENVVSNDNKDQGE